VKEYEAKKKSKTQLRSDMNSVKGFTTDSYKLLVLNLFLVLIKTKANHYSNIIQAQTIFT